MSQSNNSRTYQLFNIIINSKPIRSLIFNHINDLNYLISNLEDRFSADDGGEFLPLRLFKWSNLEKNTVQLIQYHHYHIFKQQMERYLSKYDDNNFTQPLVERLIRFSFRNGHIQIIDFLQSLSFKNQHLIDISKIVNDEFSSICFYGYFDIVQQYHRVIENNSLLKGICKASSGKNVEIIGFLLNYIINNKLIKVIKESDTYNPKNYLVTDGHLEFIKYLVDEKNKNNSSIANWSLQPSAYSIQMSACNGHLDVIRYVFSTFKSINICNRIGNEVAKYGQLEVIKYIDEYIKRNCAYNNVKYFCTDAMDYAAENGHFEMVKWLHHNRTEGCTTNAMDYAAKNGHIEIIKFLYENRTEGTTPDAMRYAIHGNHLEVVKFLYQTTKEEYYEYFSDYLDIPLSLDMIKFINENILDYKWSCWIIYQAATNGDLESIKYIHSNRKEKFSDSMKYAAFNGHLNIVEWLYENQKEECTRSAFMLAVEGGHLDIIKYFYQNGFKYAKDGDISIAAKKNHLEIVKFLAMNSNIICGASAVENAAENGNLEMIKFLHQHYCNLNVGNIAICNAVRGGHYDIVKYLHENFSECRETSFILHSEYYEIQLSILEYLLDRIQLE